MLLFEGETRQYITETVWRMILSKDVSGKCTRARTVHGVLRKILYEFGLVNGTEHTREIGLNL